jgi:hypothetical protein
MYAEALHAPALPSAHPAMLPERDAPGMRRGEDALPDGSGASP